MSISNDPHPAQPVRRGADATDQDAIGPPPGASLLRKIWWWFDFLVLIKIARLRFIAILAVIGAVMLYWETLSAYYEKWTRPFIGGDNAASAGFEFFCPMHPQVVTDNPKEKCPICAMNLSKRPKQGETTPGEALPAGVATRLQLSPYQVVTAGVRTWEVKYEPLSKKIETVGTVEFDERKRHVISARVRGRLDKLYANVTGQTVRAGDPLASVYSETLVATVDNLLNARNESDKELVRGRLRLWGVGDDQIKEIERTGKPITHITIRSPVLGHIIKKHQVEGGYVEESAPLYELADLSTVWVEAQVFENDMQFVKVGLPVKTATAALPGREFSGTVAFVFPHLDPVRRTLRVRFTIDNPDHDRRPEVSLRPGGFATVTIAVPAEQLEQRYQVQEGRVLAVPESAVVHTGSQKIVFRQEMPTVFDAVRVELGPPIAGPHDSSFYPIVKGLEAGDKVVTSGSYLLDAETRVSAAAGSIYYGGTGAGAKAGQSSVTTVRPTTPEDEDLKVTMALGKLSTPDRRLAEAQGMCPIAKERLGSMGRPVKLTLNGEVIFLCCQACEADAKADPEKTLKTVQQFKLKTKKDRPKD